MKASINHKNNIPKKDLEYFHLISTELGERYFKVDWVDNKCVQVVLDSGKKKKGRPHMNGVYHLAVSTFRASYHWYFGRTGLSGSTNVLMTTENQYLRALEKAVQQF
jgi:hypothetical protein